MGIYDKKSLAQDLTEGVTEVHFIKQDGSLRVMRCTLDPKMMPPKLKAEDLNAAKEHTERNPDLINVWDIDAKGWRSFYVESVQYAQFMPYFNID